MSLTREQAEAAFAPGSVAVVAGAGTGKTHMLTHRYLHHLASGLSPLELVAVTFTERAAAELRSRVRQAVQGSTLDAESLAELEAAQISTLHALAARICRDHPDEAEVPADFTILDDLDKPVWLGEQFAGALHALDLGVLKDVPYSRLRALLWRLVQEPSLSEAAFTQGSESWSDLLQRVKAEAARTLRENPSFQDAAQTVRGAHGADSDKLEGARKQGLSGLEALDALAWNEALEHFGAINLQGGSKKNWPSGDLEAVKAALKTLRELVREAGENGLSLELGPADEQLAELLPALNEAFQTMLARLQAAKREARVLDFADLELRALKALGHDHVRAHYRARWQAFLIDEFQDTSPIQAALLRRLTEGATVTLVGDEKQAIYGFRGADAAVFKEVRNELQAAGGTLVALSESFRTHAPLVGAVNTVFGSVMGRAFGGLRAARRDPPGEGPFVSLRAVAAERGVRKLSRRVQEARALGETLKELVATAMPVQDGSSARPLAWGDIAVLTRTWTPLDTFSEVFSALGIPAVHTGGGNLLETREAKDGLALVRTLADPHDDLALAALLRSPFFALDDPTLTRFAQSLDKDQSWWAGMQEADGKFEPARTTLERLMSLRHQATPTRLLQQADYLTGYSAVLANLPGAERRLADWRGLLDLVRRLEGSLADIFVVARRLRGLLQVEADLPRPTLEAGNAVSLMTIHRSKGLEWPLVIVADLDHAPRARSAELLIDRHLGVAFEVEDALGQTLEPALFTLLKARAKAAEEAEAKRVLYVALTRARDKLILSATQHKGGGLELLAPGLEALGLGCEALPFDPELSLYPPLPEPAAVSALEGEALWSRSPEALGPYRRYLEPKGAAGPQAAAPVEAWDEVLVWVSDLDDAYVPHVEVLRDAGVVAPHPDSVGRELTRSGATALHSAICVWTCEGFDLALVDSAVPDEVYDQQLVRLEVENAPQTTTALVQDVLRGETCVS